VYNYKPIFLGNYDTLEEAAAARAEAEIKYGFHPNHGL
jgi:AP2 domain